MPDSSGSPEHVRIGPASRPTGGTKWTCPHTTSPKAEPPKGALGPRAGRRRLGPRTPPSVPRRAAPDRHLESPKPPPRPSNTPFRGAGPPLDSISPPRRPPHHAPKQGPPPALPGKLSRLTGEGPPPPVDERGLSPLRAPRRWWAPLPRLRAQVGPAHRLPVAHAKDLLTLAAALCVEAASLSAHKAGFHLGRNSP